MLRDLPELPSGSAGHATFSRAFRIRCPEALTCSSPALPLHDNLRFFIEKQATDTSDISEDVCNDHDRIGTRTTLICYGLAWLDDTHTWPGSQPGPFLATTPPGH